MTDFSTIRPSISAVPKAQTITRAAQLGSTFDDTTLWPTENGHKILDGELALSTTSETVITNGENLYPDLWARSPLAWKSGSDLTIPAQFDFGTQTYTATILDNAGSPLVSDPSSNFIQSVTQPSAGRYNITFKAGFFASAPSVHCQFLGNVISVGYRTLALSAASVMLT